MIISVGGKIKAIVLKMKAFILGVIVCQAVVSFLAVSVLAEDTGLYEQKLKMLDQFLTRSKAKAALSPLLARLEEADKLKSQAQAAHKAGQESQAVTFLNQAIGIAVQVAREKVDPQDRIWLHRARYDNLLDTLPGLEEAYRRHLAKLATPTESEKAVDFTNLKTLQDQAHQLAVQGQYEEANVSLEKARDLLVKGLKKLLDNSSLIYELKFDTPEQEYQYERNRFISLEALLRMALAENPAKPEVLETIHAHVAQSQQLHQQAEQQAAQGKFKEAVKSLEQSNAFLGKGLNAAGVMISF
ncbi:MAG: hypothetical protein H7832_10885 [Magnetococcus sp. DMHC-6]